MLAYVFLGSTDIQRELLLHGFAYAYRPFALGRLQEYEAYESIARTVKAGLWANPVLSAYYDAKIAEQEQWRDIEVHGLALKTDLPSGVVTSGSVLHFSLPKSAQLYVSFNHQHYTPWSGSLLLSSNQTIRAYAAAGMPDTDALRSPIIEHTYIVADNTQRKAVRISEVYPSPAKGENEWIELENRTDQAVSLAGWQLDDRANGGSIPWRMPADTTIPADAFLLFPKTLTHLSLNNGGDSVRLLKADGTVADSMTYDSVKTGRAVAWNTATATWCLTDKPSPLNANTCFIQNKKSTQKKVIKKGTKQKNKNKKLPSKTDVKNQLYERTESGVFAGLEAQLLPKHSVLLQKVSASVWEIVGIVLCLFGGALLLFLLKRRVP